LTIVVRAVLIVSVVVIVNSLFLHCKISQPARGVLHFRNVAASRGNIAVPPVATLQEGYPHPQFQEGGKLGVAGVQKKK